MDKAKQSDVNKQSQSEQTAQPHKLNLCSNKEVSIDRRYTTPKSTELNIHRLDQSAENDIKTTKYNNVPGATLAASSAFAACSPAFAFSISVSRFTISERQNVARFRFSASDQRSQPNSAYLFLAVSLASLRIASVTAKAAGGGGAAAAAEAWAAVGEEELDPAAAARDGVLLFFVLDDDLLFLLDEEAAAAVAVAA
jgi:hypothetical protein